MTELAQERFSFIELLHEVFFTRKGHGAYAYITVTEAMTLFDEYLVSGEQANQFINHYVRSI